MALGKFYILFTFKHNKIICTYFIKEENEEIMNKLDHVILNGNVSHNGAI